MDGPPDHPVPQGTALPDIPDSVTTHDTAALLIITKHDVSAPYVISADDDAIIN